MLEDTECERKLQEFVTRKGARTGARVSIESRYTSAQGNPRAVISNGMQQWLIYYTDGRWKDSR